MTRTFIALEMNDAVQSYLREVIRQVALVLPNIRWVDPFSPHLTLARVKSPLTPGEQQHLQEILTGEQQNLISSQTYPVTSIQVVKSDLSRMGAHYIILQSYAFGEK